MDVYPLKFEPIFKRRIWGGRALAELLSKDLPTDEPVGESWEVADLEDDQSVVANGPASGQRLGELVRAWGTELIGRAPLIDGRFPLLIKYLDAHDTLSVQVHPDEAMARRLGGRVRVKNEAWYVINATEAGFIYRGVRQGVDAHALKRAIEEQKVESVLNRISVREGQCYYLPSGTIHALGAGVVVAEVQTPSDITYRVYDWNRIDRSTGSPRELHLDRALECTSFDTGPIVGESREHVASVWTTVTQLVRCESFAIDRVHMADGVNQEVPAGEFLIWMILKGRGTITYASTDQPPAEPVSFGVGDTLLIPAGLKQGHLQTEDDCTWLEVAYPVASPLASFDRPDRAALRDAVDGKEGLVQLDLPEEGSSP